MQRRRRPKRLAGGGGGKQYHLKVIGRALDVLECFADDRTALNLREISRLMNLPESSLFRILVTLESRGYLLQSSDGTYRLPPKLLFGKLHAEAEKFLAGAKPHLAALAGRFNETASAAYLFGDRIQVLDTVESLHEIRMTNTPGRVLPPHCSSLGKAITAFQEPGRIDRILEVYGLVRRTEKTVVDRQALLSEYARIRQTGYATDREETVSGGLCIGAAVRLPGGSVAAAISVSAPLARMGPEREQEVVQAVLQMARKVARGQ